MSEQDPWKYPRLVHVPSKQGRKRVSIPDITQFSVITRRLFGVGCKAPTEVYRCSTYNEVNSCPDCVLVNLYIISQLFLLRLDLPADQSSLPRKVLVRVARDLKTRSDMSVATMVYVKHHTNIPVPTVYGYCPTRENLIGQPFSIISFTEGSDMNGVPWEDLPLESKLIGVRDFANIISQLSQLHFQAIGSIYFK
ncbi:hypothetical protein B0H10DRAFT_1787623, partial [Mycena sp. CBHHK59/15]